MHELKDKNRLTILQIIREQMFDEKEYKERLFPGIAEQVLTSLMRRIKGAPEEEVLLNGVNQHDIAEIVRKYCEIKTLLKEDPNTIILIFSPLIRLHLSKHVPKHDLDDCFQEVISKLLTDKLTRIYINYEKDRPFVSYFMATVRNTYRDVIKSVRYDPIEISEYEFESRMSKTKINLEDELIIIEELQRLDTVLSMYYGDQNKLKLVLKLKYRLPVTAEDVKRYCTKADENDITHLTRDYSILKDGSIYEAVLPIFNKCEKANIKAKTLERWAARRVSEIIKLMNGFHEVDVYDRNHLSTLVSLYFLRKSGIKRT